MNKILVFALLSLFALNASAADLSADVSIVSTIVAAMAPAADKLLSTAITWLAIFAGLQLILTNIHLLANGAEIEQIYGKLLGSLFWIGFCIYVLKNGPSFIHDVGRQFFDMLGTGGFPTPGSIIASTIGVTVALGTVAVAVGLVDGTAGQLVLYIMLFLFGTGMFFAIKILMVQLELGLIVVLSPLSFSLLGLNALKDQGIAPFKSLISLGYRILLMTIILSAFSEIGNVMVKNLSAFSDPLEIAKLMVPGTGNFTLLIETIFSGVAGYLILFYMLYKSDAIAASLAGGHTNMGTADVAGAVAAGVAAGAAIGAGSGALANAAARAGPSMGDFIKGLTNQMGVSNAGGSGAGSSSQDGSSTSSHGLNSFTDGAPKSAPKPPDMSAKDLNKMAAEKGISPTGTGSTSRMNPTGSDSSTPLQTSSGSQAYSGNANDVASTSNSDGGVATTAGIEAAPISNLEKNLSALVESMSNPKKPTLGERLSTVNDHVARESAATHVSINAHHE